MIPWLTDSQHNRYEHTLAMCSIRTSMAFVHNFGLHENSALVSAVCVLQAKSCDQPVVWQLTAPPFYSNCSYNWVRCNVFTAERDTIDLCSLIFLGKPRIVWCSFTWWILLVRSEWIFSSSCRMVDLVMDNPFGAGSQTNYSKSISDLQGMLCDTQRHL